MTAYYNEFDPYAAQWLRNLIAAGHIAPGEVDERSIIDVGSEDLAGFDQCHFFAGIGGWSLAARLARWDDDRELWTGSAPCQPFSVAGKGEGQADERHLWPEYFRLIAARSPAVVMGEQVAAAVGKDWLDGVFVDLEGIGYACGAAVVPACAVDAPHRRDRLWFVADAPRERLERRTSAGQQLEAARVGSLPPRSGELCDVADACRIGSEAGFSGSIAGQKGFAGKLDDNRGQGGASGGALSDAGGFGCDGWEDAAGWHDAGRASTGWSEGASRPVLHRKSGWDGAEWAIGADGKARRVKPGLRLLAHGVPARVGKLRAYGNAIVPQVAAEVISAYLECQP